MKRSFRSTSAHLPVLLFAALGLVGLVGCGGAGAWTPDGAGGWTREPATRDVKLPASLRRVGGPYADLSVGDFVRCRVNGAGEIRHEVVSQDADSVSVELTAGTVKTRMRYLFTEPDPPGSGPLPGVPQGARHWKDTRTVGDRVLECDVYESHTGTIWVCNEVPVSPIVRSVSADGKTTIDLLDFRRAKTTGGAVAGASAAEPTGPITLDTSLVAKERGVDPARKKTSWLLAWKTKELPTLLREAKTADLTALVIRIEQTILDLNFEAERAKSRAQRAVESGRNAGDDPELSLAYKERIEVLKPILGAIKEEVGNRGK